MFYLKYDFRFAESSFTESIYFQIYLTLTAEILFLQTLNRKSSSAEKVKKFGM